MSQSATFRYHMHPLDLHTRRWHIKARRKHPQITDWLFHLTTLAQNARAKGRILIGGAPAEAEDIALAWNPNASDEEVQEWAEVLDTLVEAEVLTREEQGWSIARPSEWYLPPSKLEERNHNDEWEARKARRNAARRKATEVEPTPSRDSQDPLGGAREDSHPIRGTQEDSDTLGNAREESGTLGNAREESGTLGNAREETGTPGNARLPNQNQNQYQNQYPYPALPQNPGNGSGSGRVDEPAPTATDIVQDHLPGILSPHESRALARLMTAQAPPSRKLDALRQACAEVAYEAGLTGSKIRFPRRVAIERAITALARAPDEPPDPWANPPQLPEYARIAMGETPPDRRPPL